MIIAPKRKAKQDVVPLVNILASQLLELIHFEYLQMETIIREYRKCVGSLRPVHQICKTYVNKTQTAVSTTKFMGKKSIVHCGFPENINFNWGWNFESVLNFWPFLIYQEGKRLEVSHTILKLTVTVKNLVLHYLICWVLWYTREERPYSMCLHLYMLMAVLEFQWMGLNHISWCLADNIDYQYIKSYKFTREIEAAYHPAKVNILNNLRKDKGMVTIKLRNMHLRSTDTGKDMIKNV